MLPTQEHPKHKENLGGLQERYWKQHNYSMGSIHVIHHINKSKDKNHLIISIDVEKAFDKVQHPFMIKNPQQSGNRGSIPQHNKGHIWKTYSQHHTQWTKIKSFPTKIRNKTRMSTFTTSIHILLEVLAPAIRQEKEIKGIQIG